MCLEGVTVAGNLREANELQRIIWGIEISSHRQFKYLVAFKIKEKDVYFKYISVFREKYRYEALPYLRCILSDP